MLRVPLGYQPQHVMSVVIPVRDDTHTTWADRVRFYTELRDKIAAMPGVLSAGTSTNATPPNSGWRQPVEIMGRPAAQSQEAGSNSSAPNTSLLCRSQSSAAAYGTKAKLRAAPRWSW